MGKRVKVAAERWTWEEIAALRDQSKLTREQQQVRKRFLRDYGDRARAALMAAGHPEGTWMECPFTERNRCSHCALSFDMGWVEKSHPGDWLCACSEYSMAVYRCMVKELGYLP